MEVGKSEDSSNVSKCLEETGVVSVDMPVRQAFQQLLNIPVCEFQNAIRNAFTVLSKNVELDLNYGKEQTFNENFDISSVRQTFYVLFKVQVVEFHLALIKALIILAENVQSSLKSNEEETISLSVLNIFVFVMEIPMMQYIDYLEEALPAFCKAASHLSVKSQAALARTWSTYQSDRLREMLNALQQLISHKIIYGKFTKEYCINNKDMIIGVTTFMSIIYFASLLGGEVVDLELTGEDNEFVKENEDRESTVEDNELVEGDKDPELSGENNELVEGVKDQELRDELGEEEEIQLTGRFRISAGDISNKHSVLQQHPLSIELNIRGRDCWKPLLHFKEFYHELLSKQLEMDRDFSYVGNPGELAFIMTPEVKVMGLYYDNRINMESLHQPGDPENSFLKLWVRRDHLIEDALVGLKMVAMESPTYLRKKLVVEFDGEEGVDGGGLSKEFFQLAVEEIFNPDFAMFTLNSETQTYWFNPTTFENDEQFVLIGIILGLAIYNNVILDVHFPMIVYQKLMGKKGTFYDLRDWSPSLWKGLNDLLSYTGDDLEEVFMQSFSITYTDVFGTVLSHNLKEVDDLLVNQDNKKEFIHLYSDFLLNKSISTQFQAFKKGFQMVTKDSLLETLFRPEELELIICGDKNFDFNALERATKYDGGYRSNSAVIKWFWRLVHNFTLEQKRKLLQFTTGSDRIPVGGLSKLKFIIARNGGDSERLPAAHTCCNVLLLPEYGAKKKLKNKLLKAMNYSKGFGLL